LVCVYVCLSVVITHKPMINYSNHPIVHCVYIKKCTLIPVPEQSIIDSVLLERRRKWALRQWLVAQSQDSIKSQDSFNVWGNRELHSNSQTVFVVITTERERRPPHIFTSIDKRHNRTVTHSQMTDTYLRGELCSLEDDRSYDKWRLQCKTWSYVWMNGCETLLCVPLRCGT